MTYDLTAPLIIQRDKSLLLEVENPLYEEARDAVARFAELVKSPERFHTYRLSPLSLWNAAAAGMTGATIIHTLARYSRYGLPEEVATSILDWVSRYGRLRLERRGEQLILTSEDISLIERILAHDRLQPFIEGQLDAGTLLVKPSQRGHLKRALVDFGYPAEDLAGYIRGAPLSIRLKDYTKGGFRFRLRTYQREAVDAFYGGGSGVVVLPCGAGKTMVGLGAMARLGCATLILTPSTVAARQWMTEILDKTDLRPEELGEYTGEKKAIRPITIATYQIATYRSQSAGRGFPHFRPLTDGDWGLIIYDEVQLLPAPVFRFTADLQACRRLGLTATLVREDGREKDVFSLIGPKRCDIPWRDLERQGWIATARCHEIRIPLPERERLAYAKAEGTKRHRLAAENEAKLAIIKELLAKHRGDRILIIGQYLRQLRRIARMLGVPLITGGTPTGERERLYELFRTGEVKLLVLSRVSNLAIDLPDANVAIQVSGTFGSRQEEAQRLGRILRPKRDGSLAHFYSLITSGTKEQEFAQKRQLYLTEQGYKYSILYAEELASFGSAKASTANTSIRKGGRSYGSR